MLLIEADGKTLLAEHGITVPAAVLVSDATIGTLPGEGPWIVKAQVPVGGRGKAGGIVRCETPHGRSRGSASHARQTAEGP